MHARHIVFALIIASTSLACSRGCGASGGDPEAAAAAAADMDAPRVPASLPLAALGALPATALAYAAADLDAAAIYAAATAGTTVAEQRSLMGDQVATLRESLSGAATLGTFVPEGAHSFAVAGWASGSWVAVLDGSAFAPTLPEVAPPVDLGEGLRIAFRHGFAFVGSGAGFEEAIADTPRLAPQADWADGWAALPADAAFAVLVPRAGEVGALAGDGAHLDQVRRGLLGGALGGEVVLALETSDSALVQNTLGAIQTGSAAALRAARTGVPGQAAPWLDLVELGMRGVWSRVSVARTGETSTVRVAAPTCGSSLGYFLALGAMAGASADALAEGPGTTPFVPPQVEVADGCRGIDGPAPALPTKYAAFAGDSVERAAALGLFDLGGLLRGNLPTLFHTLPFALPREAIEAALGPTPLGLEGLGDPNAVGALFYREATPPEVILVVPNGTVDGLGIPIPPGITRQVVAGVGTVLAAPAAAALANAPQNPASPWAVLAAADQSGSVLGVFASRALLGEALAAAGTDVRLLNSARAAGVTVSAELALTLLFYTPGEAVALADAAKGELEAAVQAAVAENVPEAAASLRDLADTFTGILVVDAVGADVVRIRVGTSARQSRAMFAVAAVVAAAVPYMTEMFGDALGTRGAAPDGGGKPPRGSAKP